MPIWLRRVTYGHLIKFKQIETDTKTGNKSDDKLDFASAEKMKNILRERANSLGDKPDYTTKAHK